MSWQDKSAQSHQVLGVHCFVLKVLHHLAGLPVPRCASAKPTSYLRMLPPVSHCPSGCPALAPAQEVPKAFGGVEHLPGLGFNRSHRYKKTELKASRLLINPCVGSGESWSLRE